ncbi:DUF5681 domain-containing protein [Desulfonatronum thiodismutans]|uniref:DUF5681 domain-containing protein n=1 Tax=Desulfonatronum thiodismutans TaxID=159290 RepID=UPI0004ABD64D|nr:DUF5681 domain-containing protein [Desulfonatronum thiodismutans]
MTQEPDKAEKKQGGRTRFKPGQSGNPQGRKLGSRNRVSVMVDELFEGEAQAIAQAAIQKAKEGDSAMLKALLDRICPPRKERPITLDLPSLVDATAIPDATRAIIEAATKGELEPGQAVTMIQAISGHLKAIEISTLESRLSRLEEQQGG